MAKRYFISRFQINFRYERSNYSNYYIDYVIFMSRNEIKQYSPFFEVASVHKNNIGKPRGIWFEIKNEGFNVLGQKITYGFNNPNVNYSLAGVTYEHDWWITKRNRRTVLVPCPICPGEQIGFSLKMSNSNEFYQRIFVNLSSLNNGNVTRINGKGYVDIQRWDS